MKVPFVQQVEYFEKRVLDFDAPSVELVLGDQKRLVVDAFARYRITDALALPAVGRQRGRLPRPARADRLLQPAQRAGRGAAVHDPLAGPHPADEPHPGEANRALAGFGVELVDVRIKRADLPPENSQAIFRRMQTEREREAKELRAQGAEIGQRIRARADRERRVLIAEAQREAEILRGQGDAEAIRIFAEAFGQDPEFFDFYRSLQAYREAAGRRVDQLRALAATASSSASSTAALPATAGQAAPAPISRPSARRSRRRRQRRSSPAGLAAGRSAW